MILLDKPKLKFLLAGRTITTTVPHDRYRKGRSYAVGVRHNRTVCRAEVLTIEENGAGFVLEIRQVREQEPPLFLARNPGGQRTDYVTDPAAAARDEPEVIDRATQRRLSEVGTLRWQRDRAAELDQRLFRSLAARLKDAGKRQDVAAIRRIQAELKTLERRMASAA